MEVFFPLFLTLFIVFIMWLGNRNFSLSDRAAAFLRDERSAAIKDKYAPPEAKPAAAKPSPPPDTPRIAALMAMVSELEAAIKARENCIEHLTAETKRLEAMLRRKEEAIAKLDDTIATLRRGTRQTMTRAQYRNLQFCLHPDRVAYAHDEEITARYTQAFRWLADTEEQLVN
jgi:hypothetical protein